MRTVVLVAALSIVTAFLMTVTAPTRPTTDAAVTSLTVPHEVIAGERISVRGSVLLPSDDVLEGGLRFCHVETGACGAIGRDTAAGPGHWVGFAGELRAHEAGTYRVIWTLHAPWDTDTTRAATRAEAEVIILAAPE